jgi:YesN/AraC family two-component response regulator
MLKKSRFQGMGMEERELLSGAEHGDYSLDFNKIRLKTSFERQLFDDYCRVEHKVSKAYRTNRLHTHSVYEVLYCMSDNIFFLNNDIIHLLHKDDLVILNDTDVHGIIADPGLTFDRYVLIFEPDFIHELCDTYNLLDCFHKPTKNFLRIFHLSPEKAGLILSFYNKLSEYNDDKMDMLKLKKKLILAEMLIEINVLFQETAQQRDEIKPDPQYEKIQRILSYIENNLAGDLSLDSISKRFYISTSYLSALFREVTGYSLNNYIINKRITLAIELLKQNKPVTLVSELCGFNNYSHFIRTFKKIEGVPPKRFTMRWRKKTK